MLSSAPFGAVFSYQDQRFIKEISINMIHQPSRTIVSIGAPLPIRFSYWPPSIVEKLNQFPKRNSRKGFRPVVNFKVSRMGQGEFSVGSYPSLGENLTVAKANSIQWDAITDCRKVLSDLLFKLRQIIQVDSRSSPAKLEPVIVCRKKAIVWLFRASLLSRKRMQVFASE
jgi:hypothetical protein